MKSFSADQLRQQRFALAAQIAQIQKETLRGSLIERYKRCGKPGCRCAQSKGHGPKYYLSSAIRAGDRKWIMCLWIDCPWCTNMSKTINKSASGSNK